MNLLHKFKIELPSGKKMEVGLRKPTRREIDEADMTYSAYVSECISRGILTREMLLKKYKDFGGALSDDEVKEYRHLLKQIVSKNQQLLKTKAKKKKEELEAEIEEIFNQLQEIEQQQEELFGRTAEVIARNQTILWLAFLLSHDVSKTEEPPIFEGLDHDERYDAYSEFEENSLEDAQLLLEKICLYIAFWYSNRGVGPEEFKALDTYLSSNDEEIEDGEDAENIDGDS